MIRWDDGRAAQALQRVDLLGDPHRAQLGGVAGPDPAGQDQPGEHRAELEHDRFDDHPGQIVDRDRAGELIARLQRRHAAREAGDQQHDEQAADADVPGLGQHPRQPDAHLVQAPHQVRHHQRHPADVRGGVQEPAADQAGKREHFGGHDRTDLVAEGGVAPRLAARRLAHGREPLRPLSSPPMAPKSTPVRAAPSPATRRRLPPPTAPLVPPSRPRSPLAPHPRPVPRPGLRVHAAADPGRAGRGVLSPLSRRAIRPSSPWPAPSPQWSGRAGPDWATTGGPPICIGWRRRSCATTRASIPADPAVLVQLPGIGRYTAGAVASFAYERATPAIDTNVARVIRRAFHPRLRRPRRRAHSLGDGRRDRSPAGAARRPGPSIRRSWSSARWSAPPGSPNVGSARSGARARRARGRGRGAEVRSHPERSEGAIAVV